MIKDVSPCEKSHWKYKIAELFNESRNNSKTRDAQQECLAMDLTIYPRRMRLPIAPYLHTPYPMYAVSKKQYS